MANTIKLEAELRMKLDEQISNREIEKLQKKVDQISLDKGFDIFARKYEKLANMEIKGFKDFEKQKQGMEDLEAIFGKERTAEFTSAMSKGAEPTNDSGIGDIMKGMQGLMGLAGKILGGVAVIAAIANVFKPVATILNSISKMIGEFFRPISMMFMVLLQPVLQLLRPVLLVFRTMMAPFMQAALKLSREGTRDMMEGNTGKGVLKSLLAMDTLFLGLQHAITKGMWESTKILIDVLYNIQKILIKTITMIGSGILGGLGLLIKTIAPVLGNKPGNALIGAAGSVAESGGIIAGGLDAAKENFFRLGDAVIDKTFDFLGDRIENSAAKLGTNIDIPNKLEASWEKIMETFVTGQRLIVRTVFDNLADAWSQESRDRFALQAEYSLGGLFDGLLNNFNIGYNETVSELNPKIRSFWDEVYQMNEDALNELRNDNPQTSDFMTKQRERISGVYGDDFTNKLYAGANEAGNAGELFGMMRGGKTKDLANSEVYEELAKNGYTSLADATIESFSDGGKVYGAWDDGLKVLRTNTEDHFVSQSTLWQSMYGRDGTIVKTTKEGVNIQSQSMRNLNAMAKQNQAISSSSLNFVQRIGGDLIQYIRKYNNLIEKVKRSSRGRGA